MAKINLRTSLYNKTENKYFNNEVNAILDSSKKIKYLDRDITVILERKDNSLNIIRKCDDYEILLPLTLNEKTKGYYKVNSLGVLDMEVTTTNLVIGDKTLEVEYQMIVDNESVSEFKFYAEYM